MDMVVQDPTVVTHIYIMAQEDIIGKPFSSYFSGCLVVYFKVGIPVQNFGIRTRFFWMQRDEQRYLQLDWPCDTGVRVINLSPSRCPNSLFFSDFEISRAFPIF